MQHAASLPIKAQPVGSSALLPAFSQVSVHRVRCVVHRGAPETNGSATVGTDELWAVAAIDLEIDGRVVQTTDDRGEVPDAFDRIEVLSLLRCSFTVVDPSGKPLPVEADKSYRTSLGVLRIKQVPSQPWKLQCKLEQEGERELLFELTKEERRTTVRGAAELLCCKKSRRDSGFRIKAAITVDQDKARELVCGSCSTGLEVTIAACDSAVGDEVIRSYDKAHQDVGLRRANTLLSVASTKPRMYPFDLRTVLQDAPADSTPGPRMYRRMLNAITDQALSESVVQGGELHELLQGKESVCRDIVRRIKEFVEDESFAASDLFTPRSTDSESEIEARMAGAARLRGAIASATERAVIEELAKYQSLATTQGESVQQQN